MTKHEKRGTAMGIFGNNMFAFHQGGYLAKAGPCQEKVLHFIRTHVAMDHSSMIWMSVETWHSIKTSTK